jgi:hypothetical protein
MAGMSLLCPILQFALLTASSDLVINNCDDAKQWRGAVPEKSLVKEGVGAVRWDGAKGSEVIFPEFRRVPSIPLVNKTSRGRDAGCPAPPARIRT